MESSTLSSVEEDELLSSVEEDEPLSMLPPLLQEIVVISNKPQSNENNFAC